MKNPFPVVFETDSCAPQKDPRLHDRRPVCLRVAVADKSGMAEGQVLDLSPRGCGLRLKKRLLRAALHEVVIADNIPRAWENDSGL